MTSDLDLEFVLAVSACQNLLIRRSHCLNQDRWEPANIMLIRNNYSTFEVIEKLSNNLWSLLDWATGSYIFLTEEDLAAMIAESEVL